MRDRIQAALQSTETIRRARDFVVGSGLRRLPSALRRKLFYGQSHFCPVCESDLRGFLVLNRDFLHWCPMCWSLQRHRLVWRFLHSSIIDIAGRRRRMLHIAPEPGFADKLRRMPNLAYLSADLYARDAMVRMDVCDIQYPDASFDLVYCSHVLEHVPDDRRALREFRRVLSVGGEAILLVPQRHGETIEDPALTDPVERERRFGQHDHVRIYGDDFALRIEAAGFRAREYVTADLSSPAESTRMGIDPDRIYHCIAA